MPHDRNDTFIKPTEPFTNHSPFSHTIPRTFSDSISNPYLATVTKYNTDPNYNPNASSPDSFSHNWPKPHPMCTGSGK